MKPHDALDVLLVEDHPPDARLVAELLNEAGARRVRLTHADRLWQAVEHLRSQGFHAVLLDLSLPDSEGLATFRAARRAAPEAPIVVLTGLQDERLALQALREGAQDYLVKGRVDATHLYKSLRYAVERRSSEEALRRSEERYRGLVEGSIQAILVHVDGVVRMANLALARLLGYDAPSLLVGTGIEELVAPQDRERVADYVSRAPGGGLPPSRLETRILTREGRERTVDCFLSAVSWDGDDAVLVTMVDVTDRLRAMEALKASEARLAQSQKMEAVGRLAGGVAHDFNNLLTVILACSESLLQGLPVGHECRDDTVAIREAARDAAALTGQLLAFSRQQVLHPEIVSVNAVVERAETILRRVIEEDIQVTVDRSPDAGNILADPGQIEQILMNLVVNARDAMPGGGRIHISTARAEAAAEPGEEGEARPGPFAVISVSDTGTGMDEDTRANIFEPFFTTKPPGKGTGLGLAMVYGTVRQSGGFVTVETEEGAGTTFRVHLPRVERDVQGPGARTMEPHSDGTESILVVEDAERVRRVVSNYLKRRGYEVLTAPDGQAAVALLQEREDPIDLLLTDVVMPGLGGRQLAQTLRRRQEGAKVLFMSGYNEDPELGRDVLGSRSGYIQKPFTLEALAREIRRILDG